MRINQKRSLTFRPGRKREKPFGDPYVLTKRNAFIQTRGQREGGLLTGRKVLIISQEGNAFVAIHRGKVMEREQENAQQRICTSEKRGELTSSRVGNSIEKKRLQHFLEKNP